MKEKMKEWLRVANEIYDYLDEHPDKDTYEADWPPDNLRAVLGFLEGEIELWIVECAEPKDIIRMIRGSHIVYREEAFRYLKSLGVGRYRASTDEWEWESEDSKCWNLPIRTLAIIYKWYCVK